MSFLEEQAGVQAQAEADAAAAADAVNKNTGRPIQDVKSSISKIIPPAPVSINIPPPPSNDDGSFTLVPASPTHSSPKR